MKGKYVGLSNILDGGHVVYIPGSEEEREKFAHTFHVRARLHDPGLPLDEFENYDPPKPKRRVTTKTPVEDVEMKSLSMNPEELDGYIAHRSDLLLGNWDQEEAERFVDDLAEHGFFDEVKFGVYRHGSNVGWMRGISAYPQLSRVLSDIVKNYNPEATFTAIWVARNADRGMHRDFNNDETAMNYVVPIRMPKKGGDLWVELSPGDQLVGEITARPDERGHQRFGQLLPLQQGKPNVFSPRKTHEVTSWEGTRTVLIAYTPQCLGKLSSEMVKELEDHGFTVPPTQLPEYFVINGNVQVNSMAVDEEGVQEEPDTPNRDEEDLEPIVDREVEDWEMFLETSNGKVKIGDDQQPWESEEPIIRKVEVGFTKNVEKILSELQGPLEVTYTVDPREVTGNLDVWKGAIEKEVSNVSVAILRLLPGSIERAGWVRTPGAQRLPAKLVFTVKPGDAPDPADRSTWYKRKVRLVECGNYANADHSDLYSEMAPSESVRMGLVYSRRRNWMVALVDVVAAFLRTPLDRGKGASTIIVTPPRLLERFNLLQDGELWGLVRALYGLRQAPALWSAHRDKVLQQMAFPAGLKMQRGRTVTSLWVLRDNKGEIKGVVIIYVDDILLLGEEDVIRMVAATIQCEWRTSDLTFLRPGSSIRFLGMELEMDSTHNTLYINQRSYIEEVLRAHGFREEIPLSKEHAVFEVMEEDIPPTAHAVAEAQRLTGEVMWLAHKTRPDVAFTSSLMASITLRAPSRCIAIGHKVLRYLQATKNLRMAIQSDGGDLVLYPDAAFAPNSGRSHTGWTVYWAGTPVSWRSGRQSTIALSTAESELQAILDGAVGSLGLEAMLLVEPATKVIASDSTSALAIGAGTGSWRTRHLRLKSAWIQDMLSSGEIQLKHQPGLSQPADLLTKALSAQRIRALLDLWAVEEPRSGRQPRAFFSSETATKALVGVLYSDDGGRGKPGRTHVSDYEDNRCGLGSGGNSNGIADDTGWVDVLRGRQMGPVRDLLPVYAGSNDEENETAKKVERINVVGYRAGTGKSISYWTISTGSQ